MSDHSPNLCFYVNADWYFELHWLERARSAISEGYSVHLVCGKTSDSVVARLESLGIICHPIFLKRGSLNPLSALVTFTNSFKAFRTISPDIIVCITLLPSLYGGFYAKFFNESIVYSITGTGWVFSSASFVSSALRFLVSAAFRYFSYNPRSYCLFENSDDRDLFLRNGMCKELSSMVISGAGVNTAIFSPNIPSNSNGRPFTFLFASRLLNSKGLDTLIAAASDLYDRGFKFSLNICGIEDNGSPDSIPETNIEHWRTLPFVSWLGERKDMPFVFSQADVAVLPTRYGEGVPRFLIEASSCGLPCIATDVSGCRDIVLDGDTGYLVQPGDSHALANKMLSFITNSQLVVNFGKRARDHVVDNFNQDLVISQTLSVYKSLLR